MVNSRLRIVNQVLSIVLVVIMAVSILPLSVTASLEDNSGEFTFTIKDIKGKLLDDASISYEIDVDGISKTSGNICTANGEAIVSDMSNYSDEIADGKKVEISYIVSKTGYNSKNATKTVTNVQDNIDIIIAKGALETVTVSVTKTGDGTVELNSSETSTVTVNAGSTVKLKLTPNTGSYIKEVKIDGVSADISNKKLFEKDITANENVNISVIFVKTYMVNISKNDGGTVSLDGKQVDSSVEFDENSNITLSVTADNGYQISTVTIDGDSQTISDATTFFKSFKINANTNINVAFIKIYKITISYDNNRGSVETDPECVGGDVTVKKGENISITATPKETYRVKNVVINGNNDEVFLDNTYDKDNPYKKTLTADKDYTVEITFAPLVYKVTADVGENGSVKIENLEVDYGESANITINPNTGYTIDEVKVNGVDVKSSVKENDEDDLVLNIDNVTGDKTISVTFKLCDAASMSNVEFNSEDAVRSNMDGTLYVFTKGSTVKFTTDKQGIKIIYSDNSTAGGINNKSVDITTTKIIKKIQLRYDFGWHEITNITEINPLKIVIDEDGSTLVLKPDDANINGYYNDNVSLAVEVEDTGDYSGLNTVEYWVSCDGKVTQREELYTYVLGDEIKNQYSGNIVVNAQSNNSDNVVVHLRVTDRAGNEKEITSELKINITEPTISVSIDGTLDSEAAEGYYNDTRTASITIVDRATTFDEVAANDGIDIKATDVKGKSVNISKSLMISKWTHSGDKHTATVTFSTDAHYVWKISYKNKADSINDENIKAFGESVYEFTVDTLAPTGKITIDTDKWEDQLIFALTFGICKNYSVTAIAEGYDKTSPINDIKYYKSNSDEALTEDEILTLYNEAKFTTEIYTVKPDEQFVVYARIADYAGNVLYISSNGVILDNTKSEVTLTPESPNEKGFYGLDYVENGIKVDIKVNEEIVTGNTYSGIKSIDYKVINDNNEQSPTQSDNLYTFDITNPTKSQLKKDWFGSITVDPTKNNSDNVKVIVTVSDNAGNTLEKEVALAINIEQPTVSVSFDNNNANRIVDGRGYFASDRTATITIVDRASVFNEEKATEGIKIDDVSDYSSKQIDLDTSSMISEWSNDGDIHTAKVLFSTDANYTWSFSYTNDAGNQNNEVDVTGCETPYTFTVDKNNPKGTVSVNVNTWDKLLDVLTFGLYSNVRADVTSTSNDDTSPVIVEYFKTENPIVLTAAELENQTFSDYKDFSIESDEQFVVYLKIIDYAGNYIYINSDGYIVDKIASNIEITAEEANTNGLYGLTYNDGINVDVKITDAKPYSGIKTVDYWVVKDNDVEHPTQKGNLFTFNVSKPVQADLVNEWKGNITVNPYLNNSCNVVVYIKTVDNAGNENTKFVKLDVDVTAPKIDITYNNNHDNKGNTYFNAVRTATVVITERNHHFDSEAATKGIAINAVDVKGNSVENSYTISSWTTIDDENQPDASTHTATIAFEKDANYTFAIEYTDKADNSNETPDTHNSVASYKFTVDTTAPVGTVKAKSAEGREDEWSKLRNELTFGFWSNSKITISGTTDDITSPVASVKCYKMASTNASDATTALTKDRLDKIMTWTDFKGFSVTEDEQFIVYIKITDQAGNYTYISTNGLIVDSKKPLEEVIAPKISIKPKQPINGIYNDDVKVSIKVTDPKIGGTYSGLKNVSYKVFDKAVSSTEPTQSGTLYNFTKINPAQKDLRQTWTGEITVDSSKNNSNNISIVVYAVDNSLNASDDKISIKIDTTAPAINISYDNNSADSGNYFKANRTATIVITERNFKADDVKLTITNTDGIIPAVTSWKKTKGQGNKDNTSWTATITYSADGDYKFAIAYTDLAGNRCKSIKYADSTVAGTKFTIDKTISMIDVSYDNNSAENTYYYKSDRTATIVITEHNFNADRVQIDLTSTDDGVAIDNPSVSGWSSNGNKHTATISFNNDALYTLDISFADKAGNKAADFKKQTFYIDKTAPKIKIKGVANNSANRGDVIPVISYSDTNFDNSRVSINLEGANRGKITTIEGSYTDIHNGRIFTFNNFKKEKSIDDIYTLTASLTDKAGNMRTQKLNFSVNRFGSTYLFSTETTELNGSYAKTPVDIVVTEINPNKLKNIKITLFKNDKTITLNEHTGYKTDVSGGSNQWYKYKYTIFKNNFKDDGVYRLTIHSEDVAGNVAENTLDTKYAEIEFGIDKTLPTINVNNLENGKTYAEENKKVRMSVNDNLNLASVIVYLDGKEYKNWTDEELENLIADGGNFTFNILGDSISAHTVEVVAADAAENEYVEEITDFYVTTNILVRYYNNKILFFGSIGGLILIAFGIIVLVVLKKRKTESQYRN